MLLRTQLRAKRRQGLILLVVIAILAIFSILGVTFVLYSSGEAEASRIAREAENQTQPDMDPELALNLFLEQFLFGVPDSGPGLGSALRGHTLLRDVYGYNDATPLNQVPFNGTGRLSYGLKDSAGNPIWLNRAKPTDPPDQVNPDNAELINYSYFSSDSFLRDPERLYARVGDMTGPAPTKQ
jgi:hypothetical protein